MQQQKLFVFTGYTLAIVSPPTGDDHARKEKEVTPRVKLLIDMELFNYC